MIALLWSLGTVLLAIIIHIGAVLAIPILSTETAWHKLYDSLELNVARVLPAVGPQTEALEQLDPMMIVAVCRYDLDGGPLQLTVPPIDGYWSLSFITKSKTTIYSVNDRTVGDPEAGIFAVSAQQARRFYAQLPEDQTLPLVVEASADEGVAILRILASDPSLATVYRGLASEYRCGPAP